jgi:enediyne biosynthesis protein E4
MTDHRFLSNWTRRKLLRKAPALCASAALPHALRAALSAQTQTGQAQKHTQPLQKPFSTFVDVSQKAGLTAKMIYGNPEGITYIVEEMGGGCAFFDYDNDGWMDVFILGGRTLEGIPPEASNRLYKNNRDGTFTDVTKQAGLWDAGWAMGVAVGDYNNDGFEDLFVTYYGQSKLYRNNGDGTFTDVTEKAGLLHAGTHFGSGCTFLDYNRDGHLDLFVANYVEFDFANAHKPSLEVPNCSYKGVPVACGPKGLKTPTHFLYRNNGDGTFTDVSKESGIASVTGSYGLTAVSFDIDEDGWPDIFVACDTTPSLLFLNNHDGTFREEALLRGVALSMEGLERAGMGVGIGDYTLSGHLDIAKTHFQTEATGLYLNDGKGEFEDDARHAGIAEENTYVSWGTGIVDLDNDGHPDIFWVTGNVYAEVERIKPQYPYHNPRVLYRNRGDGTFARVHAEAGPAIDTLHVSRGCAFGDFDNDGDLDILIMNQHEPPTLLRNDAPQGNNWLKIRLEGTRSNRSAIGATVLVQYGGKKQAQALLSQSSYLSANDPRLHFGLGQASAAEIEVRWPSGTIEKYPAPGVNRLITIQEGKGIVPGRPFGRP